MSPFVIRLPGRNSHGIRPTVTPFLEASLSWTSFFVVFFVALFQLKLVLLMLSHLELPRLNLTPLILLDSGRLSILGPGSSFLHRVYQNSIFNVFIFQEFVLLELTPFENHYPGIHYPYKITLDGASLDASDLAWWWGDLSMHLSAGMRPYLALFMRVVSTLGGSHAWLNNTARGKCWGNTEGCDGC